MDIGYRVGGKEDLDVILHFLEKRQTYSHYIGFESPAQMRRAVAKGYRESGHIWDNPDCFPLIIALDLNTEKPLGYMLMNLRADEAFRDDFLAYLYDYYIDDPSLWDEIMEHFLKQAEMLAEEEEIERTVVNVPLGETGWNMPADNRRKPVWREILDSLTPEEEFLRERGFYIEMNRIAKQVETFTFDTPLQKNFRVRQAEESDRIFILNMVGQNSEYLILPGAEDIASQIQQAYFNDYSLMDLSGKSSRTVLICEDVENYRLTGYIILQTEPDDVITAEKTAYLYDISTHKDYWGRYATQRLMREAENWLAQRDFRYIYADISHRNPRPLKTALKSLDYSLISRRWAKKY